MTASQPACQAFEFFEIFEWYTLATNRKSDNFFRITPANNLWSEGIF